MRIFLSFVSAGYQSLYFVIACAMYLQASAGLLDQDSVIHSLMLFGLPVRIRTRGYRPIPTFIFGPACKVPTGR